MITSMLFAAAVAVTSHVEVLDADPNHLWIRVGYGDYIDFDAAAGNLLFHATVECLALGEGGAEEFSLTCSRPAGSGFKQVCEGVYLCQLP